MTTTEPETLVFTITTVKQVQPQPVTKAGFRLWEKAVIATGAAVTPAPFIASVVNGHTGWTPLLFIAGATACVATVLEHAHVENTWKAPTPAQNEFEWTGHAGIEVTR